MTYYKTVYWKVSGIFIVNHPFSICSLGIEAYKSFLGTSIFIVSPSVMLYENFLFYTYPVTVLLCLSALLLYKYYKTGRKLFIHLFFISISSICLIRSMFHLFWFLAILLGLLLFSKGKRGVLLKACAIPLVILFGFYFKNHLIFDSFSASTWGGMSIFKVTVEQLDAEDRVELIKSGVLNPVSAYNAFQPLDNYRKFIKKQNSGGFRNIPVLTKQYKKGGEPNFNHLSYIDLSDMMFQEAFKVISHRPFDYFKGVIRSFRIFFRSTSDVEFLYQNRLNIDVWDLIFNKLFYGQNLRLLDSSKTEIWNYAFDGYLLYIFIPLIVINGFGFILRSRKKAPESALVIGFMLFNIFYVSTIANMAEIMENNRFRFNLDHFFLVLLILFIGDVWNELKRRKVK